MTITVDILKTIAPSSKKTNYKHLAGLALWMNHWFPLFEIDSKGELCHLLCQWAHESDSFNAMEEYASGKAYEGRKDLGNVNTGDGIKYKGRGPTQTTGRVNYSALDLLVTKYFGNRVSFIDNPELLEEPEYGVWASLVYWDNRDFNTFANMPDEAKIWSKKLKRNLSPLEYISWRINGGFNGLASRLLFYERAKEIIK